MRHVKKGIVSCLECTNLHQCHRMAEPLREQARSLASRCEHPARGYTTDVVGVWGRDRGLSRKKAVRLASLGFMMWVNGTMLVPRAPLERAESA
jgi:hypothetical protein